MLGKEDVFIFRIEKCQTISIALQCVVFVQNFGFVEGCLGIHTLLERYNSIVSLMVSKVQTAFMYHFRDVQDFLKSLTCQKV